MGKLTRLQIVQRVLSSIEGEEVSAVGETQESAQVALLLDQVYETLLGGYPWNKLRKSGSLYLTSVDNEMQLPDDVHHILTMRYNKKNVTYISPEDMRVKLDSRDTTLSTVDSNGAYNNQDPQFWTSFDDEIVTFDAYDSNLVEALSYIYYIKIADDLVNDLDIPIIPAQFHPVLVDGVLARAFTELKGDAGTGQIYAGLFRKGTIHMKVWARRTFPKDPLVTLNYGRRTHSSLDYGRRVIET